MTNTPKLKGRIAERGYNMSELSKAVNLSRPALTKKVNGETEFRASEIEKMCSVLGISKFDICEYFFA